MTKLPIVFRRKKPLFLCLISIKHWKNKQKLCQNKYMSSNWSCGLVQCSFVNLIERVSKKGPVFAECPRMMREKHFWQKKVLPQIVATHRQTAVLTTPQRSFCRKAKKKFAQVSMMSKKRIFSKKKSLQQISLTSGNQFWQNCYLFSDRKNRLFFVQCFRRMKKHTKNFQSRCLSSKWSFGLLESSVATWPKKKWSKTDQFAIDVQK